MVRIFLGLRVVNWYLPNTIWLQFKTQNPNITRREGNEQVHMSYMKSNKDNIYKNSYSFIYVRSFPKIKIYLRLRDSKFKPKFPQ